MNGYFDRWRRNRDYQRNLIEWMNNLQSIQMSHMQMDLSKFPSRTVIMKGRAVGMSSHLITHPIGDHWILDIGSGPHVKTCDRCGYTWNWKDYTKFQFRMSKRDFERRVERCVRCNHRGWKKHRLENQFDVALARMVGELNQER